uniref:Peptidase metallopeptidase domain-containing protein n=1 Tax=Cyclopterus lumpus TaxID=8103 RepID=A0A8C3G1Y0_CYCLU
ESEWLYVPTCALDGLAACPGCPLPSPYVSWDRLQCELFQQQGYLGSFYNRSPTAECRGEGSDPCCLPWIRRSFFGLKETGGLDPTTLDVMKEPRCGVPDVENISFSPQKSLHGRTTPSRTCKVLLTYRITQYTQDLTQSQVDAIIAQAFQLYSDVIPLDFKQVNSGTADIMILFKGGYHGDFYPFDGAGGVLAHANSPGWGQGGDTHFDDDERWTFTQRGVNLLLVAAHEFGHALGLDHSRDRGALMYPTYRYVNTNGYRLPDDDKHGVQALYGELRKLRSNQIFFLL